MNVKIEPWLTASIRCYNCQETIFIRGHYCQGDWQIECTNKNCDAVYFVKYSGDYLEIQSKNRRDHVWKKQQDWAQAYKDSLKRKKPFYEKFFVETRPREKTILVLYCKKTGCCGREEIVSQSAFHKDAIGLDNHLKKVNAKARRETVKSILHYYELLTPEGPGETMTEILKVAKRQYFSVKNLKHISVTRGRIQQILRKLERHKILKRLDIAPETRDSRVIFWSLDLRG